ncbi:hypothetical protein [Caminibacter pacificus]|uniref:Uncharacterized protein n=1 Tax=Caminibacter pacificus TaxID=1424653 RepID=A0AAJ4UWZ6_9BACT|nr:hypothetical protein [Caminibacter pacificus]QDD68140.1 hypothetical protein C6V80_09815 [Caminibacter pacificus]ROR38758.1 hypothetical protein EDC58_1973 [Caminibacter pacificus]
MRKIILSIAAFLSISFAADTTQNQNVSGLDELQKALNNIKGLLVQNNLIRENSGEIQKKIKSLKSSLEYLKTKQKYSTETYQLSNEYALTLLKQIYSLLSLLEKNVKKIYIVPIDNYLVVGHTKKGGVSPDKLKEAVKFLQTQKKEYDSIKRTKSYICLLKDNFEKYQIPKEYVKKIENQLFTFFSTIQIPGVKKENNMNNGFTTNAPFYPADQQLPPPPQPPMIPGADNNNTTTMVSEIVKPKINYITISQGEYLDYANNIKVISIHKSYAVIGY